MTTQLTIFDIDRGKELAIVGMQLADETAEKFNPGWKEKSYNKIVEFLKQDHITEFMCEDIRSFEAMDEDFELPKNAKAWAAPLKRAKKNGLIKFSRYGQVKNVKAHGTPAAVWEKIKI